MTCVVVVAMLIVLFAMMIDLASGIYKAKLRGDVRTRPLRSTRSCHLANGRNGFSQQADTMLMPRETRLVTTASIGSAM